LVPPKPSVRLDYLALMSACWLLVRRGLCAVEVLVVAGGEVGEGVPQFDVDGPLVDLLSSVCFFAFEFVVIVSLAVGLLKS
jgi:hypothetical protein